MKSRLYNGVKNAIDELLLKLLYSNELKNGMSAKECEEVIRQLYY